MLLYRFVARLLSCERRVCQIYLQLSVHEALPPALRLFWQSMAKEANQYRAFLEGTAGLLDFVQASFAAPQDVLERVESNLVMVERAIASPELRTDEALRYALSLANADHYQLEKSWLQGFPCAIRDILERTEKPGKRRHLGYLLKAVHIFSNDPEFHAQATRLRDTVEGISKVCLGVMT